MGYWNLHKMGCGLTALCLAGWIFAVPTAWSQRADISQNRADLLRNPAAATPNTPNLSNGEAQGYAVASPNDKDLGEQQILQRQEEYLPFTISVGTSVYYTSNVALTDRGEEDDVLFSPGVTVLYQPRLTRTLYLELGVAQQWFLYDRFSELNFGSFDGIVGLAYYLPQFHNLSLRARYDYNLLTDTDDFDDFFHNHAIILSANLPIPINRAQQIALGTDLEISLGGEPDPPRRNDYSFYIGYAVNVSRSFFIDASVRLAVRDYHEGSRTDVSEIVALTANYQPRPWLTLSFLSSFAWNQSDHDVFDYSVANVGGGVALSIRF
jgi:hypothetical protein